MKRYRILLVFAVAIINADFGQAQVTFQRLVEAAKEPQNWLTYSGDYAGRRHSGLEQIDTANVERLAAQWVFQSEAKGKFETTPLVFDGVMYVTGQENLAYALDARTGRMIWRYRHPLPVSVEPGWGSRRGRPPACMRARSRRGGSWSCRPRPAVCAVEPFVSEPVLPCEKARAGSSDCFALSPALRPSRPAG